LDPAHDHLAEIVERVGFGSDDHVIGPGHIFGRNDALDARDLGRDLRGLPDFGLDEDVRADSHVAPPAERPAGSPLTLVPRPDTAWVKRRSARGRSRTVEVSRERVLARRW